MVDTFEEINRPYTELERNLDMLRADLARLKMCINPTMTVEQYQRAISECTKLKYSIDTMFDNLTQLVGG